MIDIPEELRDEIVLYLSDKDLKNLRIASREFRHAASRELFAKRNKGRLILGGGHDEERGFRSDDAYRLSDGWAREIVKRKPVEFCRLKSYLPSILPIAQYFTALEYAPIFWDADLLSVRIGTHSGQEDGFCYSCPYTLEDWQAETGFQSDYWRLEKDESDDENELDDECQSDNESQLNNEHQLDGGDDCDDEDAEPPDVDIWVDKPYVIPDRYTMNKERINAAGVLKDFVKEQEANFEESLEALKEIVLALKQLQRVTIDHWYCYRLKEVIFHWGELRESSTTRVRRNERHVWRNYQTLISILRDTEQKPWEIAIRSFPQYQFIGTNMPSALLSSSMHVMQNLQQLRICFMGGESRFPGSLGSEMAPSALYKLLDSCKESLRALRLEFDGGMGPSSGCKDLSSVFGGGKVRSIVFPKLEELFLNSLILLATDLERLIESQKSLRCLCLYKISIYARAYDWKRLFENIITPSKIDRISFYEFRNGPAAWNNVEPENWQGNDFDRFPVSLISTWEVHGWRSVPVNIYSPVRILSTPFFVREKSEFEVFNTKEHPIYVMKNNRDCTQDDKIYGY